MSIWRNLTKIRTLYIITLFTAIYITLLIQTGIKNRTFTKITYEIDSYKRNITSAKTKSLNFVIGQWKKHIQNKRKSLSSHDKYFGLSKRKGNLSEKERNVRIRADTHHELKSHLTFRDEIRKRLDDFENNKSINEPRKNSLRAVEDESKSKKTDDDDDILHQHRDQTFDLYEEVNDLEKRINKIRNELGAFHKTSSNATGNIQVKNSRKSRHKFQNNSYDGYEDLDESTTENVWSMVTWKDIISSRLEYSPIIDEFEIENIKPGQKLVLLFTSLWNDQVWGSMDTERVNNIAKEYQCPRQNCVFTYNKRFFNRSDAVVFHVPDLKDPSYVSTLSKYGGRSYDQKWVYFNSESPNSYNTNRFEDGLFNLTMTYDSRSDIPIPYGRYRRLRPNEIRPSKEINYAENRKNGAVWFVSNCGMRLRKWLAKELEKYISVDVGGYCEEEFANNVQCQKADGQSNIQECRNTIRNYKYYFAFESRFCRDYITEKYWDNAIANGVIPIVLGGANYSDPKLAIPGSFIDAQKFESVQKLGEYLQKLNANDELYNGYLRWKQTYKRVNRHDWPYTNEWVCDLCANLNKKNEKRTSHNFTRDWNKDKICDGDRNEVIKDWYLQHWREYQISNNISDESIPIDDYGNKRWDVLEDASQNQLNLPDENDEDEIEESLSEEDNDGYFSNS